MHQLSVHGATAIKVRREKHVYEWTRIIIEGRNPVEIVVHPDGDVALYPINDEDSEES